MTDNQGRAEDELPEEVREFFAFQSKKRAMNSNRFAGNNSQTLAFRFVDVRSPDRHAMPTNFVSSASCEMPASSPRPSSTPRRP